MFSLFAEKFYSHVFHILIRSLWYDVARTWSELIIPTVKTNLWIMQCSIEEKHNKFDVFSLKRQFDKKECSLNSFTFLTETSFVKNVRKVL